MNPFEFVVAVVLIFAIVKLVSARNARLSAGRQEDTTGEPVRDEGVEARRLREEVQTLKERIAVLERIATDDSGRLAREIEQLRDR